MVPRCCTSYYRAEPGKGDGWAPPDAERESEDMGGGGTLRTAAERRREGETKAENAGNFASKLLNVWYRVPDVPMVVHREFCALQKRRGEEYAASLGGQPGVASAAGAAAVGVRGGMEPQGILRRRRSLEEEARSGGSAPAPAPAPAVTRRRMFDAVAAEPAAEEQLFEGDV